MGAVTVLLANHVAEKSPTHADKLPHLSSCSEMLGFDVILDKRAKPKLMEVNRSPSMKGDSEVTVEAKKGVLGDIFCLTSVSCKWASRGPTTDMGKEAAIASDAWIQTNWHREVQRSRRTSAIKLWPPDTWLSYFDSFMKLPHAAGLMART